MWQMMDYNMSLCVSQVANEVIGEMNLKPEDVFLAQGTLRPDLIESASHLASGKAEMIKTHHNDTELIRKLRDEVKMNINQICVANMAVAGSSPACNMSLNVS